MRIIVAAIFTMLLATGPALAQSTAATTQSGSKPSAESVHRLLEVMQAKKIVEAMSQQVDAMYTGMVNKLLEGKSVTPEQRKSIEARRAKMADLFKDVLSWDSMERLYLKVYGDTFTQSEIDGMTAFYSSPTGHAVIAKLPLAMKSSMTEMQERMRQMMPKIEQLARETAEEIKAQPAPAQSHNAG